MVSHKLRIKSIHWENIRNYEQLLNDNIGSDRMELNAASTLLQIQNNYGKTTTMHLLRSTFTGIPILPEHLEGYNYKAKHNRVGGNPGKIGTFKVFLSSMMSCLRLNRFLTRFGKRTSSSPTDRCQGMRILVAGVQSGTLQHFSSIYSRINQILLICSSLMEKRRGLNRDASTDKIGTAIRQVTGLWDICDLIDEGSRKGRITGLVIDVLSKNIGKRGGKTDKLRKTSMSVSSTNITLKIKHQKSRRSLDRLISERDTINQNLEAFDKEKMQQSQELTDAKDAEKIAKNHLAEASQELMKDLFNPANIVDPLLWNEGCFILQLSNSG